MSAERQMVTLTPEISSIPDSGPFPSRVTLELTNRCNLNCTFCPRRLMERHQGDMPNALACRLLDEMADHLPVTLVPFFRGETLLHPDWRKILSYAKKRGIGPVQLTTNAMLLDTKAAAAIVDLEIDFISFSLDTVDPYLYERTRRGSSYATVLTNIRRFLELKARRNRRLPVVQVSAVATREHLPGIDAFVSFWQPLVDRVRVYIEHSGDGRPGSINEPLPAFSQRLPCFKPFTDMVVYWDGMTALCNHDWTRTPAETLGNASEQSLAAIWQGTRYQEVRQAHRYGEVSDLIPCNHCDHWKMYYLEDGHLGQVYENPPD
ncbi:MAG: radical SAM protein [Deltaproteobacteria bacterium]|nr:radical SAM protein [Candidatus Anaeroferrophillacea bacterium]